MLMQKRAGWFFLFCTTHLVLPSFFLISHQRGWQEFMIKLVYLMQNEQGNKSSGSTDFAPCVGGEERCVT